MTLWQEGVIRCEISLKFLSTGKQEEVSLPSFVIRGERKVVLDFDILRSRLEQEQKGLNKELEQLDASNRSITMERREGSPYGKRAEEANGALDLEKRIALETRKRDTLAQVEHALQKLDDGTYGLCDNCGQPINPARVEALPQANLCVNCKALQEK